MAVSPLDQSSCSCCRFIPEMAKGITQQKSFLLYCEYYQVKLLQPLLEDRSKSLHWHSCSLALSGSSSKLFRFTSFAFKYLTSFCLFIWNCLLFRLWLAGQIYPGPCGSLTLPLFSLVLLGSFSWPSCRSSAPVRFPSKQAFTQSSGIADIFFSIIFIVSSSSGAQPCLAPAGARTPFSGIALRSRKSISHSRIPLASLVDLAQLWRLSLSCYKDAKALSGCLAWKTYVSNSIRSIFFPRGCFADLANGTLKPGAFRQISSLRMSEGQVSQHSASQC